MFKNRRGHALRLGRSSIEGQAYLLTGVTQDRLRLFADFRLACVACRAIADPRLWRDAHLMAWVLMPDHFHLLVQLGPGACLPKIAQRVKSVTSLEVGRVTGTRGIWQHGYHDRAIRAEECLRDVGRYVVFNPVRAGLVERVADYPFWGAAWVAGCANPLEI